MPTKLATAIVWRSLCLFCVLLCAPLPAARAGTAEGVQHIVDSYARDAVRTGRAVGVGVGIVYPGQPLRSFGYGYANAQTRAPFTGDTLFEIASITKIFTTNLLGQSLARRKLSLDAPLSLFSAQLGALPPLTARITLGELADFTAGLPTMAPLCSDVAVPGCMPDSYPNERDYPVTHFVRFFRDAVPMNYYARPAAPLSALPGPSYYSNFSTGLLGLLLATPTGPIGHGSVDAWFDLVRSEILAPLNMNSTYLRVPDTIARSRVAAGYQPAAAEAVVQNGQIVGIKVTAAGMDYAAAPIVSIIGGHGDGATAVATVADGSVATVAVRSRGHDYLAPPEVIFSPERTSPNAHAHAIAVAGRIVAIEVTDGGGGYQRPPRVTISGGRLVSGRDAEAVAHIANGRVTDVAVLDGGSKYVVPLAVVVAPGRPEHDVVPAFAAAGSLISSVADLTTFAAAALGKNDITDRQVPTTLTQGFRIAQAERACVGLNPSLDACPPDRNRVGLAWSIQPADAAGGTPRIVSKAGGLAGFSSEIVLLPEQRLAVVVLVNAHVDKSATTLAFQIAYALLAGLAK